jgi:hypothetical protein
MQCRDSLHWRSNERDSTSSLLTLTSTGLRDRPSTSIPAFSNTHLKKPSLMARTLDPPRSLLPSPRKLHLLQRRRNLEALPRTLTADLLARQHQQPRRHRPSRRRLDPLSRRPRLGNSLDVRARCATAVLSLHTGHGDGVSLWREHGNFGCF